MSRAGSPYRKLFTGATLLLGLLAGAAAAEPPETDGRTQLLQQADSIKTSNHVEFVKLLEQLDGDAAGLSQDQRWYLRYLDAWQVAYAGDYDRASTLLSDFIDRSPDATLRFRATATLVNILGIGHRSEEAFTRLSQLLEQLPQIVDQHARFQGLGEAAQMLIAAGQYDLAAGYAEQMLMEIPPGESACKGMTYKLHAHFRSGRMQTLDPEFHKGVEICVKSGETLFANELRGDIASFSIHHGRAADAVALLEANYADVRRAEYPILTSQFSALLAQAYWKANDATRARKFAVAAIDDAIKSEFTEPLSMAYELLYRIEEQQGNFHAALAYHEKYMEADKGYLTDVSAKTLAYQIVNQQVQAKKGQVDALNKQNQILQLQQALDHKAVETGRLYIILLLTVLASIGLLLYRLKRSQLRFMKLARRDGLTGICNRQHFVEEAEQALRYAARSARTAGFIIIDLDHFKLVNDTHGHAVGDQVLKRAVTICAGHLNSCDVFGRLGGEEFGILLPECGALQTFDRAEQIRLAIASASTSDGVRDVTITASLGVSSTDQCGYELHHLLGEADNALYQAKRDGRNRVVSSRVDDHPLSPYLIEANG
jgi:diguanylate cyclase (GGDEF)-like protein